MSGIDSAQDQEITYISGVTAQGTIASQSYWTWNDDGPATYASTSAAAKWGAGSASTGATISVALDAGSSWSADEKSAILSALHLWSDVANVRFTLVDTATANIVFARGHDGAAQDATSFYRGGGVGSAALGTISSARITIDTSKAGFGPIGGDFHTYGGYPWLTLVHEIGHAIGLGHAGAYNEGETTGTPMLTSYDSTAWSVMSYIAGSDVNANPSGSYYGWGRAADGSPVTPVTPMALDILAAQRLYGLPASTPLSGGQVFGFHTNIQGDTARFFDFTINTQPVVTLWDAGGGNTLDLSGYAMGNLVDLRPGAFSGVGGASHNLVIAYDTRIDNFVGGTGDDNLWGNDDGLVLMGNAGSDILRGGAGNDHIWGNMATTTQGVADGNDTIESGGGTNYINGNAGNDTITGSGDANRLYGGAGDDTIKIMGSGTNHVNGNAGNDTITLQGGSNFVFGGRDDDRITAYGGNNVISGDAGNDVIVSGPGIDVMSGGSGRDVFQFSPGQPPNYDPYAGASVTYFHRVHGVAPLVRDGALAGYHDEITDFTHGEDLIVIGNDAGGARAVLHGDGNGYGSFDAAAAAARSLVGGSGASSAIAALQVGSDTVLFYNEAGTGSALDSAIKLDNLRADQVQASDFATS